MRISTICCVALAIGACIMFAVCAMVGDAGNAIAAIIVAALMINEAVND